MRRSVTAKSIPTKFCTSTFLGDVVIYLTWHWNWLRGFGGVGSENGPLPLTLALASNTAYWAAAHTRDVVSRSYDKPKITVVRYFVNRAPDVYYCLVFFSHHGSCQYAVLKSGVGTFVKHGVTKKIFHVSKIEKNSKNIKSLLSVVPNPWCPRR